MKRPHRATGLPVGRPRKSAEERMARALLVADPTMATRALAKRVGVCAAVVREWRRVWQIEELRR